MNRIKPRTARKTSQAPLALKAREKKVARHKGANIVPSGSDDDLGNRRTAKLAALYESTLALTEQHALPELLHHIITHAASLLAAPCGLIYLYDEIEGELELAATKGLAISLGIRYPLGKNLATKVVRTHQPLIANHVQIWAQNRPQSKKITLSAAVHVPMLYSGELIGVLVVAELGTTTRQFTAEDVRLLALVAVQAASVVHNARLFEQVRSSRARLEALSRRLLEAQEAERRNIARELHDEIGQAMTGVQLNLQAMDQSLVEPAVHTLLQDSIVIIENVLRQMRHLSLDLRPSILDDFGLVAALQWLVKRQAQRASINIELNAKKLRTRPSQEVETACFRVAQEALTNIIRHAHASQVQIELKQQRSAMQLLIRDDGSGFDVAQAMRAAAGGATLGLLGMQERVLLVGARIEIESAPGQGTVIRAFFSLTTPPSLIERRVRKRLLQ